MSAKIIIPQFLFGQCAELIPKLPPGFTVKHDANSFAIATGSDGKQYLIEPDKLTRWRLYTEDDARKAMRHFGKPDTEEILPGLRDQIGAHFLDVEERVPLPYVPQVEYFARIVCLEDCFTYGPYDTPEAARDEAIRVNAEFLRKTPIAEHHIETGEMVPWVPTAHYSDVIEQAVSRAQGECGEHPEEDWLCGVSRPALDELSEKLTAVFTAWLEAHDHMPRFGSIRRVRSWRREPGGAWVQR